MRIRETVHPEVSASIREILVITTPRHLANEGPATWFAPAQEAVRLAGIDTGRIRPCTTEQYPTPARRLPYSVLGSERREALGLAPPPDWRMSLPAVVARLTA